MTVDKRSLWAALQQDAALLGITPQELIKRITSGAHVVGGGSGVPVRGAEIASRGALMAHVDGDAFYHVVDQGDGDEMDELAQRREEALIAGGHDDLAREAILLGQGRADLEQNTTRTNPISAHGARLGSQALVPSNTPIDKAIQLARWDDKDSEATAVSVHLGAISTPTIALGNRTRPFAVVQWGTAGYLLSAEVDLGTGCELTVGGSTVMVSVGMDDAADGNAGSALLTAMLSFKPIVRQMPLYRTRYIDNLGIGAAKTVFVPPFAKNVLFFTNSPTDAYTVGLNDITGSNLYAFTIAANSIMTVPVVLAGDVGSVTVTNTAGGLASNCRLVFGLEL